MPALPKHLRQRWRYLAVELETWPGEVPSRRSLQAALWSACRRLYGDTGAAEADLTVVRYTAERATAGAVVRVKRGERDRARGTLAAVQDVDGAAVGVRVAGVSGTVRACEEKYIRPRPEVGDQRDVVFEDNDRPAVVRGERVDVDDGDGFSGAAAFDFQ